MFLDYLGLFVFVYPAFMAVYWSSAALIYFIFKERQFAQPDFENKKKEDVPLVSIMIPCYNEGDNLEESIPHLLKLDYPNYELIFINDGSKDNTGEIIDKWAKRDSKIVALHQSNSGKAKALNNGLTIAKGKYVGCIDGDAILDYKAISYMVSALEQNQSYGGITGNPRVRNRSMVLGRLQVSEFSAIIGLIKRAQSLMGTIFTVSGVCCFFRKEVLDQIGGWSTNMITEDIDISWKVQTSGHDIYYEPRALCWVLMPETISGLFKQRLRWAQGGIETIIKYFPQIWKPKNIRLWPNYFEYAITAIWAVSLLGLTLHSTYEIIVNPEMNFSQDWIFFKSSLLLLFITFFAQCVISIYIDSRYEKGILKYALSCIWYPWIYWILNTVTLLVGIPKAIFRNKERLATWTSPDRGV